MRVPLTKPFVRGGTVTLEIERGGNLQEVAADVVYAAACPYCAQEFCIFDVLDEDGKPTSGLIHIEPLCTEFTEYSAGEFIESLRAAGGIFLN